MSGMGAIWRQLLGIALGGAYVFSASSATAQITPDRTLPNNSNVTINGSVFNITGGTQAGRNLFHSFQQFSVPTGGTASFNNGLDIQNIISRVTGGEISNIDGIIRASGTANLFFLNPNGIVFGKNAGLSIGGSFVASTANSLKEADGFEFSATSPSSTPLLTISVPIGLQYGTNPGGITNQSIAVSANNNPVGLQVLSGNSLALVGGDVRLDGGRLTAAGGRVELGGLAAPGTVGLLVYGNNLSLSFPDGVARASVYLKNSSIVDVSGGGSGSIAINARNLDLQQSSKLTADINPSSDTPSLKVGDITVNATEKITLEQSSQIESTNAVSNAKVMPHNINITTGSLSMMNGSQVGTFTSGQGNAGNVNINARDVSFDGASSIVSIANSTGNTGNININTGTLSLTNGAGVFANSNQQGSAGSVTINASDRVFLDGQGGSGIFNLLNSPNGMGNSGGISITTGTLSATNGAKLNTATYGMGNSGGISITTGTLSLTNGAQLNTTTYGMGNAGDVNVNARDNLSFDGSGSGIVSIVVGENTKGNTGDININTGTLSLTNGAGVFANSNGQGSAGSVTINARDSVSLLSSRPEGVNIYTSSKPNSIGNNGGISIKTGTLSITNGQLNTSTSGMGNAGDVTIVAPSVSFNNGQIITSANETAIGKGGDVSITSGDISLANSSLIILATAGRGNAGNTSINTGTLSLTNGSQVITSTSGMGNAGDVTINAHDTFTIDGSLNNTYSGVFSSVQSGAVGSGSNLNITAGALSLGNNAQLSASSSGMGNAGNINITTKNAISLDAGSTVSSTLGASTAARVSFRLDENNRPIVTIEPSEQTVVPNAKGNSGNINISTNRLAVTNGARLTTSTSGQGNAGNINVNTNTATFSGSTPNGLPGGASSAVETTAVGKGGIININTDELTVDNGAQLVASTFGRGDAGSINITARDTVSFNGSPSGASSAVDAKAVGNGGNLTVDAKRLNILNGAAGDVSNLGSGNLNAGNLQVRADSINLDFGKLIADSTSGQGGNINLQVNDILRLQHNSLISNTSGTSLISGFEGNFTLNTQFLVAAPLENSDIVTNAFNGRGGKIDITANEGVFGFVVRTQQDLERLLGTSDPNQLNPQKLPTNDISAISQNSPTIISSDIDPSRGLVILPTVMEQTPKLVDSSCANFNETTGGSQFTITGHGGLPPNPDEPLTSDVVWSDTRLPVTTAQHQHKTHAAKPKPQPIAIIPVTGWVFNDKGEVTLISSVSNASTLNTSTSCAVK